MKCSRCNTETDKPTGIGFGVKVYPICSGCAFSFQVWWTVRKDEFPPAMERPESELMHACRMALDIANPHPDIRDVLRTAIKNAYEGMKK